jgi:predicted ArsR family transcriptional regulator
MSVPSLADDHGPDLLLQSLGVSMGRVEVLNSLLLGGETSTTAVAAELGITQNAAWRHLRSLQAGGLVTERRTRHPRGQGRITYWCAVAERALDAVDRFEDELFRGVHIGD